MERESDIHPALAAAQVQKHRSRLHKQPPVSPGLFFSNHRSQRMRVDGLGKADSPRYWEAVLRRDCNPAAGEVGGTCFGRQEVHGHEGQAYRASTLELERGYGRQRARYAKGHRMPSGTL